MMKPEKAAMVENHLISMARSGQMMGKFNEDQLKNLLEKISEQTQKKTVVKVNNPNSINAYLNIAQGF